MSDRLRIGIIGDWNPARPNHRLTNESLAHASAATGVPAEPVWLPTASLQAADGESILRGYHALWCASGSPYASAEGALNAIHYGRTQGIPFLGT